MQPEAIAQPTALYRLGRVDLLSLEAWDDVWRRNQHFVAQLVDLGLVRTVRFHAPPVKLAHVARQRPVPGVEVMTPHLVLPPTRGGRWLLGREARATTRGTDVLWVNDPVVGARCLRKGLRAVYDVTDDWRESDLGERDREVLVDAEDRLAEQALTVVCSEVLADRWEQRYGLRPPVVQNGVDLDAHRRSQPHPLPGPGPHLVYVGTLHHERLDVDLLVALARSRPGSSVDLVGPDHLDDTSRRALLATGNVRLHGPVGHTEVPGIMAAADVLLCPHLVTPFTLSLDAIKSFEYLASGRPVVATPSSGFQRFDAVPGLSVVPAERFADAVTSAVGTGPFLGRADDASWAQRARDFHQLLLAAGRA